MQAISVSPSFSSYSDCKLAEIAARIVDESESEEFSGFGDPENAAVQRGEGGVSNEEFEFAIAAVDSKSPSQTSADDIFNKGQIRSSYPVFGHKKSEERNGVRNLASPKIRLPLRKLFLEERETTLTTSSSSSSGSDDVDGFTAESYCGWPRKTTVEDDHFEKKSRSAGVNSKRWKLRDFLCRSNSDGSKNDFVAPAEDGKAKLTPSQPLPPLLSNQNGGDNKRLYIPYKQDFVGFFAV